MTRGRKPKPVEVKRREGNPGKRPLPDPLLIGGRGVPEQPLGLSPPAAVLWNSEVPKMARAGLLDLVDGPILGQFFEAWAVAIASMREMYAIGDEDRSEFDKGPVIYTPNNFDGRLVAKKHPAVTAWKDAVATMNRIAAEHGLTPSARTRIGMNTPGRPVEDDPDIGMSPRLRAIEGGAGDATAE